MGGSLFGGFFLGVHLPTVAQGHGCPADKPFALVGHVGKVMSCYATEEDANAASKAAYAAEEKEKSAPAKPEYPAENWTLTREQVASLCSPCGEKMGSLNITELKLSDKEPLPEGFEQALRAVHSKEPAAFFATCSARMGPQSVSFCAWLHHKLLGEWPAAANSELSIGHQTAPLKGIGTKATLHGRSYHVVPSVLVRSQVLQNNLGRSYLPASDITEDWAEMWNGIPVLIGDHPKMRGLDVSGRHPTLWDERQVGFIFNARVEQEGKDIARLLADVWLDETRGDAVNGYKAVLEALQSGKPVELSTGFRTKTETRNGSYAGAPYDLIMHPVAPDHLVVSTSMTGACSITDGCGLGVNQREGNVDKKTLWEKVMGLFAKTTPAPLTAEDLAAQRIAFAIGSLDTNDKGFSKLREGLQARFGAQDKQIGVMDADDQRVTFWYSTPTGVFPGKGEYFESAFSAKGDAFEFGAPKIVRRVTKYETVADDAAALAVHFARGDDRASSSEPNTGRESKMSENANKDLEAKVDSLVAAVQALTADVTAIKTAAQSDANPAIAGLKQQISKLTGEFAAMREVTEQAVNERERERQSLIRKLVGHYRVPFNEGELESKPLQELKQLEQMAEGTSFTGRGGPQGSQHAANEQRYAEPTSPWEKKGGE